MSTVNYDQIRWAPGSPFVSVGPEKAIGITSGLMIPAAPRVRMIEGQQSEGNFTNENILTTSAVRNNASFNYEVAVDNMDIYEAAGYDVWVFLYRAKNNGDNNNTYGMHHPAQASPNFDWFSGGDHGGSATPTQTEWQAPSTISQPWKYGVSKFIANVRHYDWFKGTPTLPITPEGWRTGSQNYEIRSQRNSDFYPNEAINQYFSFRTILSILDPDTGLIRLSAGGFSPVFFIGPRVGSFTDTFNPVGGARYYYAWRTDWHKGGGR